MFNQDASVMQSPTTKKLNMATAPILSITNNCSNEATVKIYSGGELISDVVIGVGNTESFSPAIASPEATDSGMYSNNHVEVTVEELSGTYSFWQNGNNLYYTKSATWNEDDLVEVVGGGTVGTNNIDLSITEVDSSPWIVVDIENG